MNSFAWWKGLRQPYSARYSANHSRRWRAKQAGAHVNMGKNYHNRRTVTYSPLRWLRDLAHKGTLVDLQRDYISIQRGEVSASLTWASNTSISGADRPTKVPSECVGPGWFSPGQVHLDSRWPGRYDKAPPKSGSPPTVAATGRPFTVWLGAVPTSHVSYE